MSSRLAHGSAAAAAMLLTCACGTLDGSAGKRVPLQAELFGHTVTTTVDQPIAAYYARRHLALDAASSERRRQALWDDQIEAIHALLGDRLPTEQELHDWSVRHSVDFAALVLARQLERRRRHDELAALWHAELAAARQAREAGRTAALTVPQDVLFLFVPGWMYRSDPSSGADFGGIRAALTRHGGRVELAPLLDNGSVEANAQRLAALVVQRVSAGERLVLVSGSKGGPETALALSQLRQTAHASGVVGWVNVVGLLQGTALADHGTRWPLCWWVQLAVLPDASFDGVESLTTEASRARARTVQLPPTLRVVNYLGIPLSGQVSARARLGYRLLREFGPNDGLTTLRGAIADPGTTLAEFGVDHFMSLDDLEIRIVALARALVQSTGVAGANAAPSGNRS